MLSSVLDLSLETIFWIADLVNQAVALINQAIAGIR